MNFWKGQSIILLFSLYSMCAPHIRHRTAIEINGIKYNSIFLFPPFYSTEERRKKKNTKQIWMPIEICRKVQKWTRCRERMKNIIFNKILRFYFLLLLLLCSVWFIYFKLTQWLFFRKRLNFIIFFNWEKIEWTDDTFLLLLNRNNGEETKTKNSLCSHCWEWTRFLSFQMKKNYESNIPLKHFIKWKLKILYITNLGYKFQEERKNHNYR